MKKRKRRRGLMTFDAARIERELVKPRAERARIHVPPRFERWAP